MHEYEHWRSDGDIAFRNELGALRRQVSGLKDYAIVGKSAGGVLALMGFKDGTFADAKRIVVIGFPANWAADRDIVYRDLLLSDKRISYIQATDDPKCTYSALANMLDGRNVIEEYHSKNHAYSKVKTIGRKVRLLLDA